MKNPANQTTTCISGNRYHEGFKEFLARTDQQQVSLEWFKVQFSERTDIRRILSIGCGEGRFDLAWLKMFPEVRSYIGIEPNPSHVSTFRQRMETESLPTHLSIRLVQDRFEDVDLTPGFDLICISQSLYYPKDKQGTLEKAFELLDVNGELVIFHTMSNCGIDLLKQKFNSYQYHYPGEALLDDLRQTRLTYKDEVLSSTIQIKELPKSMLEFMLERPISTEEHQQVKAYLNQNCPDGYLSHPLLALRISSGFSDKAYSDHYQIFRGLTDTLPAVQRWMQDFLATLDIPIKKVLSIGCGNGKIDTNCFLEPLDSISSYTGLDPNEEHLQAFRKLLTSYTKADVELLPQYFEDFHTDQRYDLIIMSHVLYYLPQRKFALSKACSLLNDKGILIILQQTERGIYALQKRYGRTRYSYNSVELANELDTLEIPYRYEEIDSYINLEEIPDSLIRFFLEGIITQWQANDVRQYLLHQYPEKRMHHPVGTFVISAQDFPQTIHSRLLSDAEYAKCFGEFLLRSDQHNKIIQWVQKQNLIDLNSIQKMLSVGCGTGSFDLEFAQLLPNLCELTLVEPNQAHLAALEKNIAAISAPFITHIEPCHLETCLLNGHFDLILFAHSLYYVQNIAGILKRAVTLLSEKGQLLLLHESPYVSTHQLQKRLGIFGRISLTSQHLEDYLNKLNLDFQIDIIPVALDLREVSNQMIHFLLERNPTKAELAEAHTHLLDMTANGFLTQDTMAIIVQTTK